MRVLVIGDVIDDIIVVPQGEIRTNTDTKAQINQTLGGSAGNIASWAAKAGVEPTFLGAVNSRDVNRVSEQFSHYKVETSLQSSSLETGKLVSIVEGSNRTMLTDRGANRELNFDEITKDFLSQFHFVFLSGYCLFDRSVRQVKEFITRISDSGSVMFLDPGSAGFIRDFGIEDFKQIVSMVDYFLPNEDEFELVGAVAKHTLVTKGANGVDYYLAKDKVESFAVAELEAKDPTGAGDAFSGTVLAKLALGQTIQQATSAGIASAAEAVMTIGARPQL
jgi:sugar/nucleoside kinase (ribokinase family)